MAVKGVRVNAGRDLAIRYEHNEQGATFAALGRKYGITGTRVRQVVGREDRRAAQQARIEEARKEQAMEDRKVTRDTLIDHLEIGVRLHHCLINEKKRFWLRDDPATVGDFIDMPDHELMRIPNFGRKTLKEWREVTAHLRGDDVPDHEEHLAEVKLLREITARIRMIGANHKATGTLYSKLADTLENIK